jgi:hypothetical protein
MRNASHVTPRSVIHMFGPSVMHVGKFCLFMGQKQFYAQIILLIFQVNLNFRRTQTHFTISSQTDRWIRETILLDKKRNIYLLTIIIYSSKHNHHWQRQWWRRPNKKKYIFYEVMFWPIILSICWASFCTLLKKFIIKYCENTLNNKSIIFR